MKKGEFSKPQEIMGQETLEQLFTAINQKLVEHDDRFEQIDQRLDRIEITMQSILAIVKNYDEERKEIKATLWEHDRRLIKLESN